MPKSRMARNFKARKGISRNYTLLARQKEFPKLTCKKNLPTPDTKDSDNPNNIKYILKENDTQCAIFSTELKSRDNHKDPLYLIVGALTGALLLTDKEIEEYFDLTPMIDKKLTLKDAPYKNTGVKIEYDTNDVPTDIVDFKGASIK